MVFAYPTGQNGQAAGRGFAAALARRRSMRLHQPLQGHASSVGSPRMATTAPTPTSIALARPGLRREIGFVGLIWASEGSIIGSGWLFGAQGALAQAGPAALISWGIATVIIVILALLHAELGGMFPLTGGTTRFPHYAFGAAAGASFGWFSWLQAAATAPVEVMAMIQY